MKAFQFRLDQALRWRATQVDVEKSLVSKAANRLAVAQAELESCRAELAGGAARLVTGTNGWALESWAVWVERGRRRILELEANALESERALAARMELLVQANRRQHLLENLKRSEHERWCCEFNRELEAFAGEAFLGRLQSKGGRARSSGG